MRYLFIFMIGATLAGCANTIVGNGNIVEIGREVPNFQDLSSMGSINIEIQPGSTYSLRIIDDENIIPYVVTEVKNGELQVYYKDDVNISHSHTKVSVTVPFLNNIKTSGSGDVSTKGTITNNKMIMLTSRGSGDMDLSLNAPAINISGAGSGDFKLSGETRDLECTLTGSGEVDSRNLKSENAKIKITGSGNAKVFASNTLRATISGSGNVLYWGNPSLPEVNVTGSGKVKSGE